MPGILVDAGPRVKTTPWAPRGITIAGMKTRDLRIERIQPLLPPAILIEEQPLSEKGSLMVTRAREEVADILAGRTTASLVVVGPCSIHDPAAALEYALPPPPAGRRAGAGSLHRDARLLREAAHHGGLEGAHQRPAPRRQLRHQRGIATRPPVPARSRRHRAARGLRVPRPDLPPVHRRPRDLGRHRGAHDREPGAPRAGLRALDAGRASRTAPTAGCRSPSTRCGPRPIRTASWASPSRVSPASSPPAATGLPRDPARRAERSELRRGERRGGARRPPRRGRAAPADDRHEPRQQREGLPTSAPGRAGDRGPGRPGGAGNRRRT